MCWIPWYESSAHGGFAAAAFISFIIYMIIDNYMYITANRYFKFNRSYKLIAFINSLLIIGMITCIILWASLNVSAFEYAATAIPFFYFL